MRGVILFAHGSRDPLWRGPIEAVAGQVQLMEPGVHVVCAYLELCEPDLPTAARQLIGQGVEHIRLLPLFFGMGKHAREDLPLLMDELQQTHPTIRFECLAAAGEDARLTALLARIALEPSS